MGESEVCEYLYILTYIHEVPTNWKKKVVILAVIINVIKGALHFLLLNCSKCLSD